MRHPILDNLRELDFTDDKAVASFLTDLKVPMADITNAYLLDTEDHEGKPYPADYLKINESEFEKYQSKTTPPEKEAYLHSIRNDERLLTALITDFFTHALDIQQSDINKLESVLQVMPIRHKRGEFGFLTTTLQLAFTEYLRINNELTDILQAQNALRLPLMSQQEQFAHYAGVKKPSDREAVRVSIKKEQEIQEAVKAQPNLHALLNSKPEEGSLDDRLFAADRTLAEQFKNILTRTPVIQLLEIEFELQGTHSSKDDVLNDEALATLSRLADQLVKDAKRRNYKFPEEQLIASRIRLMINVQRAKPKSKQEFHARLAPRLRDAQRAFNRHRNHKALRTLGKIALVAAIVITGVVPGVIAQAVYCRVKYNKTGKARLFGLSKETDAQDSVSGLKAALDSMKQKDEPKENPYTNNAPEAQSF